MDGKAEDDGVEWLADGGQGDLALDRLKTAGAPFFTKLQAAFKAAFRTTPPPASAAALVRFFSEYVSEDEDDFSLFNVVQDALWDTADSDPGRRDAEEAAAALYLLAACRLVKRVARHTASDLVLHVPESARIVAAIIATALFGGRLELKPASGSAMPDHPYVFDVPFGGDQPETDFERAAFAAVFSKDPEALEIALDAGPLDESARAALMAQFRRIRRKKHALALVVRGFASAEECRAFTGLYAQHRVPVLLPDRQAADVLVGMPVSKLEAEIRLFWHDLKMLSRRGATPHDSAKTGGLVMDGKAPDLVSRLQAIRDAHHLDFAMYWAITSIISPLIGADVEYPIQQMEYWLGQRSGQVAGAEATDPGPGWGAAR